HAKHCGRIEKYGLWDRAQRSALQQRSRKLQREIVGASCASDCRRRGFEQWSYSWLPMNKSLSSSLTRMHYSEFKSNVAGETAWGRTRTGSRPIRIANFSFCSSLDKVLFSAE